MKADMSSERLPGTNRVGSWLGPRSGPDILKTYLYWDSNSGSSFP